MEMKINGKLIATEREGRAWSQQHLATVSGLALRTIQRIEANGSGSYESAKAIAACLDLDISDIRLSEDSEASQTPRIWTLRAAASVIGAAVMAVLVFFSMQRVLAEQVMLDVGIKLSDNSTVNEFKTQALLDEGQELALPMDGMFNLVLMPKVLDDGKVIVAVKLYEFRDQEYELLGEPRVIASGGEEAEILIPADAEGQRNYRIVILPQIL